MNNNVLIVFIKYPEPGNVKTRLIPELGEKGSAKFYSNLVKNILTKIKNASNYDIYIFYTGNNENNFKIWLGNSYFLKKQTNGNIGSKMYFSLKKMLLTYKKAIIIGSDIPNITKKVIYNAFNKLNTTNCVLGPATDGGYYLIGFNNNVINNINNIFDNISWSTSKVLNETIDKLNKNNISYTKILELDDIDTIEDLKKYMKGINNVLF